MSPNYEFEKCMHGIFKANLKYGFLRNMEGRRDREKKGRRTEGRKKKSKRESEERERKKKKREKEPFPKNSKKRKKERLKRIFPFTHTWTTSGKQHTHLSRRLM